MEYSRIDANEQIYLDYVIRLRKAHYHFTVKNNQQILVA